MSYKSYAESEMGIANVNPAIRPLVLRLLDALDGDGHSGCSIHFVAGAVEHWIKNPDYIPSNDSVLRSMWDEIIGKTNGIIVTPTEMLEALEVLRKVMLFTPLTPLTGEDDEWNEITEISQRPSFQNRRCSTIFKDTIDGQAYNIDGRVFYEPTYEFTDWTGYTGSASKVNVDFPYDASTPPIRVYWTDRSRQQALPENIDPHAWMAINHKKRLLGRDPETNKILIDSCFAPIGRDFSEDFIDLFYRCFFSKFGVENRHKVIQAAFWEAQSTIHVAPPAHSESKCSMTMVLTKEQGLQFSRLLAVLPDDAKFLEWNKIEFNGKVLSIVPRKVVRPNKHYQDWVTHYSAIKGDVLRAIIMFDWVEVGKHADKVYIDGDYFIFGDEDSYLYDKRRQLGLAHPKRKKRKFNDECTAITLTLDDNPDPAGVVKEVITEFLSNRDKPDVE